MSSLFPPGTGLTDQVSEHWYRVGAEDAEAVALFKRHYTCRLSRQWGGRDTNRFIGPGECMILITASADALFAWRKEMFRADGQSGVNCAVFRNEGPVLSSELIREAETVAWARWPGERLFTFVNPVKVRSSNPGYCYLTAGWRRCGVTATRKLIVLEKLPDISEPELSAFFSERTPNAWNHQAG